jgi:hypothetical protein
MLLAAGVSIATTTTAAAQQTDLFIMQGSSGPVQQIGGGNNVVDLIEGFIEADDRAGWGLLAALDDYDGALSYAGAPNAMLLKISTAGLAKKLELIIPSTGRIVEFSGRTVDELSAQFDDWVKTSSVEDWADFIRATSGLTPLAVLSGNPKSTVALMGDSAYRKFGFDDSRSRMGFNETIERWGGFEIRVDAGVSTVSTQNFSNDMVTFDSSVTLAGEFGRHVGLSFSIVGQYRNYDGAKMADTGLELALPITLMRPDDGPYFWQLAPFVQAAGGVSIDFAAGGLILGGGLVNSLGWNEGPYEVLMSNEIVYYGGLPIDEIGGYDFDTEISQLYFKNGLEGTWWIGAGFYADGGVHFSNFAIDRAAVSWFATPTVGIGWEAGRWIDFRLAYEADLSTNDYRSHNFQAKLDFLF